MKVTYAPESGGSETFEFNADNLTAAEAEMIEEAGGSRWATYGHWLQQLTQGGFRAWRVAIWIMQKRKGMRVDFEEFLPKPSEMIFDFTEVEAEVVPEGKSVTSDSDTDSP